MGEGSPDNLDSVRLLEKMAARLQTLKPLLNRLPSEDDSRKHLEAMLRLINVLSFYLKEMQKCFSSNALFAANVMGAAFLETFLLWRCLGDDKRVCSTKAWQSSHKGKRLPFLKKLSKMDLGTLLSIGKELSWFSTSAEISPFFRMNLETHFGQSVADVVCKYVPPDGHSSAILSHDLRNRLHPGKLIREEFEFSDSSGAFASFCLLLAFTSMTEQMTSTTAVRATGTPFMGI